MKLELPSSPSIIQILGWSWTGTGALFCLTSLIQPLIFIIRNSFPKFPGPPPANFSYLRVGSDFALGVLMMFFAQMLLRRKPWARLGLIPISLYLLITFIYSTIVEYHRQFNLPPQSDFPPAIFAIAFAFGVLVNLIWGGFFSLSAFFLLREQFRAEPTSADTPSA